MKTVSTSMSCLILIASLVSPQLARADICERSSDLRIHVVETLDHKLSFEIDDDKGCHLVGPFTSYASDEIDHKREDAERIIDGVKATDAVGGIAVLLLFGAAMGDTNSVAALNASHIDLPEAPNRDKVPHAKVIAEALDYHKMDTTKECVYVDSVQDYRQKLAGALQEIYDARDTQISVSAQNQAELHDVKPVAVPIHALSWTGPQSRTPANQTRIQ